ncbi:hypothetical protein SAY87_015606 [Trapa incisa]|uniref:DRBM domain-containing protein n=1 Tax=Trapa incisa TaxID=236973 RepID=A0AAN7LDI0_9MYRT|nr:hypothetical protein SAY87_015606 [Trapa incisa]
MDLTVLSKQRSMIEPPAKRARPATTITVNAMPNFLPPLIPPEDFSGALVELTSMPLWVINLLGDGEGMGDSGGRCEDDAGEELGARSRIGAGGEGKELGGELVGTPTSGGEDGGKGASATCSGAGEGGSDEPNRSNRCVVLMLRVLAQERLPGVAMGKRSDRSNRFLRNVEGSTDRFLIIRPAVPPNICLFTTMKGLSSTGWVLFTVMDEQTIYSPCFHHKHIGGKHKCHFLDSFLCFSPDAAMKSKSSTTVPLLGEGPDHAPRFKATVNFNGETFESPQYCSTLRQAEHSAAEVALNSLSSRGPSHSLAARILDETGVYKNLLQEIAQRVGAPLPQYITNRSGLGHLPVFTGTVELAGIAFTGEPAKNKKQAEKNAAMAAWSSLKQLAKEAAGSSEPEHNDEMEQITIARALLHYRLKGNHAMANSPGGSLPFQKRFPSQIPRPTSPQHVRISTSKILPLICPKTVTCSNRPSNDNLTLPSQTRILESRVLGTHPHLFPTPRAAPYAPNRQIRANCRGIAPPVTIRTAVPVFSAAPCPIPPPHPPTPMQGSAVRIASSVCVRQVVPVFDAPPALAGLHPLKKQDAQTVHSAVLPNKLIIDPAKDIAGKVSTQGTEVAQHLNQLKI